MADRLPADLRAELIEFARERIKDVSHDAGYVSPQTLAENIVAAQEFAWLAHFTPIARGVWQEGFDAGGRHWRTAKNPYKDAGSAT
jgi:hypothetical protein